MRQYVNDPVVQAILQRANSIIAQARKEGKDWIYLKDREKLNWELN